MGQRPGEFSNCRILVVVLNVIVYRVAHALRKKIFEVRYPANIKCAVNTIAIIKEKRAVVANLLNRREIPVSLCPKEADRPKNLLPRRRNIFFLRLLNC